MAVYDIIKIGDPVLREKAAPVPKITPNIIKLLDNLKDTLENAKGAGLAAPQIGISKRVVVVAAGDGMVEMVNPEIVRARGEATEVEGCLSIPDVAGEVPRAKWVLVRALDRNGNTFELEAEDLAARACQHEIDHLDGILFVDKVVRFLDNK